MSYLEAELRQQTRDLNLEENVVFTGVRHDIPALLGQSDVFALSSRWEGVPLSVIEAMAAARPVVATRVGGNEELIEDGRSGLLLPAEDAEALAQALLALLPDPARRQAMGQAARQRVQLLFSQEHFTRQYEALYARVGRQRPAPPEQPMPISVEETP